MFIKKVRTNNADKMKPSFSLFWRSVHKLGNWPDQEKTIEYLVEQGIFPDNPDINRIDNQLVVENMLFEKGCYIVIESELTKDGKNMIYRVNSYTNKDYKDLYGSTEEHDFKVEAD